MHKPLVARREWREYRVVLVVEFCPEHEKCVGATQRVALVARVLIARAAMAVQLGSTISAWPATGSDERLGHGVDIPDTENTCPRTDIDMFLDALWLRRDGNASELAQLQRGRCRRFGLRGEQHASGRRFW